MDLRKREIKANIEGEISDVIDAEPYTQENYPLILPCGHTFSKKTVENIVAKNKQCPLCRTSFDNQFKVCGSCSHKIKIEFLPINTL